MLPEFAIGRSQFTLVVLAALIALGAYSLITIPKAEDPTFPVATFEVIAVLPGAAPEELERLVVEPVEARLFALDDVHTLKTEIEEGLARLQLEFEAGTDPDRKRDEVLREINSLRPELPAELVALEVHQHNPANVHIVEVALVSPSAPYRLLQRYAHTLRRQLENARGVGKVTIAGLPEQEVTVSLDTQRLLALGVSAAEVIGAISAESLDLPAGNIEAGGRRFSIKTSGEYASVEEIGATVVRSKGAAVLRVADVASVALNDAEATHIARFDGQRAVLVLAAQKEGENIMNVMQGIDATLASFASTLPSHISLQQGFRQISNVADRLQRFSRDFGLAIVLVLITLLPLGLRASLVVMVSIPLSLSIGVLLLKLTGFTINQVSVVGFVISLGLLVDDSVVVVENIARHLREGAAPRAAAIAATKQITASVIGCTATLLFAFLPLLALPGPGGQFVRGLPMAVVTTVLASLLVSLTVVPFLASFLLRPEHEHGNVFFRLMTWAIEGTYRRVLDRAVARPWATVLAAALLFVGSLALLPWIGLSVFPRADVPQFLVRAELPEGASLAESDRAARFVERALARHPEVSRVASSVGKGHPLIFYNVAPKGEKSNIAEIFAQARTHDTAQRDALFAALRAEFAQFPGGRLELKEFESGPPLEAPLALRVLGDDDAARDRAARQLEQLLLSTDGARDVRNPSRERRTDIKIEVDRDRAALLAVRVADVDRAVRLAVGGVPAGRYREPFAEEPYDIRVTLPRNVAGGFGQARADFRVLDELFVPSGSGLPLPLGQVASTNMRPSATAIRHYDKQRSATVTAYVRSGFNTDRVIKQVLARLATLELPAGTRVVPAGEVENRHRSFSGLGVALIVAAFGVLAVLVLEFRTFKSTCIVLSVIPLGVVGGLLALFLTGYTLSFTATIGFIALMGIEVKNSILLVDFTNQLREQGLPVDEAIRRAGNARFVPILLTTLTAIGGLIPLVLERSSLYSPLALVILGGLVSSTLLTRVVTPAVYRLLQPDVEVRSM